MHWMTSEAANISQSLIRFDIYDWVPIFAILFVTAIVLNTVFPNRHFVNFKLFWKADDKLFMTDRKNYCNC